MDVQDFLIQGEGHEEDKREAWQLFQQAYERQMKGELEEAVTLYKKSIETHPTAEAYTFLGWTYSFMGRLDDAIEECHKAIAQDPDFGNPYNDIGAYLIEKGELDEAITWFQKALHARRYESPAFPISTWVGSTSARANGPRLSIPTRKPWRSIPIIPWPRKHWDV